MVEDTHVSFRPESQYKNAMHLVSHCVGRYSAEQFRKEEWEARRERGLPFTHPQEELNFPRLYLPEEPTGPNSNLNRRLRFHRWCQQIAFHCAQACPRFGEWVSRLLDRMEHDSYPDESDTLSTTAVYDENTDRDVAELVLEDDIPEEVKLKLAEERTWNLRLGTLLLGSNTS